MTTFDELSPPTQRGLVVVRQADEQRAAPLACVWCKGRCHRAAAGAHWRVEWSLSGGPLQSDNLDGANSECEAAARAPLSALPGSLWALVEVRPNGEIVWLRFEAQELAKSRLELLRNVAQLSRPASAPLVIKAWRALLVRQRRELSRPLLDPLMSALHALEGALELHRRALLATARSSTGESATEQQRVYLACTVQTLERVAHAVFAQAEQEAQILWCGWAREAPELAAHFHALAARGFGAAARPEEPVRPLRYVQALFAVGAGAGWHAHAAKTSPTLVHLRAEPCP